MADQDSEVRDILVHLARLGLSGRAQDVHAYLRRVIRKQGHANQAFAAALAELVAKAPTAAAPLRDAGGSMVPVDADSRLALLRHEHPAIAEAEPILTPGLHARLEQVVAERSHLTVLAHRGLIPTRSLLFVGPPGVGKTLCARWLAQKLGRPLLTLDLATVMSSYLGKTGSNIRAVLDYAKSIESVLLLDEFDAVAKRRDDEADIGELRRLVTVILQEIDDWPSTSLLIAATNHGELLDPAVWRRFDDVLSFDTPSTDLRLRALERAFGESVDDVRELLPFLLKAWEGRSYSDIFRTAQWIRRRAAVGKISTVEALLEATGQELQQVGGADRKKTIALLATAGVSDRKIQQFTGVSRDTLRKYRSITSTENDV